MAAFSPQPPTPQSRLAAVLSRLKQFVSPAGYEQILLPRVSLVGTAMLGLVTCAVVLGLATSVTYFRLNGHLQADVDRGLTTAHQLLGQAERELSSLSLTLSGTCREVDDRLTRASLDSSIVRQFIVYDAAADRLCAAMPVIAEEVQAALAEFVEQRQQLAASIGAPSESAAFALIPTRGLKPGLLAVRGDTQGRVLAAQVELGQFALAIGALGTGDSRSFRLSLVADAQRDLEPQPQSQPDSQSQSQSRSKPQLQPQPKGRSGIAVLEQVLVGRHERAAALLEARARSDRFPVELVATCSAWSLVFELLAVLPPSLLLALTITGVVVMRWNTRLAQRASPERRLRRAVRQRRFEPVIQPIVDARTGRCLGGEVLMRWDHPIRGMVAPAEFVGLAEQTGLIVPMTQILMRKARDRLAPTLRRSPDLYFSFNVTVSQLADPQFPDELDALFDDQSLPPRNVVVEMIERDAVDERVNAGLRELRRRGYRIAIDDFGTGQSSLAVLARIECDRLKIDREFVRAIDEEAINRPVLDAIIELSHRLKLPAIAEGVETPAQRAYLVAQGVAALQGYLIARPMPIGDFGPWLDENESWVDQAEAAARQTANGGPVESADALLHAQALA